MCFIYVCIHIQQASAHSHHLTHVASYLSGLLIVPYVWFSDRVICVAVCLSVALPTQGERSLPRQQGSAPHGSSIVNAYMNVLLACSFRDICVLRLNVGLITIVLAYCLAIAYTNVRIDLS